MEKLSRKNDAKAGVCMLNTMSSSFYFWFLLFFVLIFPFFLPLWIRISFHNLRKDNSVSFELEISLLNSLRMFLYKKNFSPTVNEENLENFLKYLPRFSNIVYQRKLYWISFSKLKHILDYFLSSFTWERMDILCKLGTGDPAATGIITGFLRFISSVVSYHIINSFTFTGKKPRILMYPSFLKRELFFFISININSSVAKILIHLFLIFFILIKEIITKNFWRWVRNGGSSYSRFNDNSDGKLKRNG